MLNPGSFLEGQRFLHWLWRRVFFVALIFFVALNVFIRPVEPHFGLDEYPGFWAVFGLGVGYSMIFGMKRIIQPLIVRKEDYYDDL